MSKSDELDEFLESARPQQEMYHEALSRYFVCDYRNKDELKLCTQRIGLITEPDIAALAEDFLNPQRSNKAKWKRPKKVMKSIVKGCKQCMVADSRGWKADITSENKIKTKPKLDRIAFTSILLSIKSDGELTNQVLFVCRNFVKRHDGRLIGGKVVRFVDFEGRIYKSMEHFLEKNKLPKCLIAWMPLDSQEMRCEPSAALKNCAKAVALAALDAASIAVAITGAAAAGLALAPVALPLFGIGVPTAIVAASAVAGGTAITTATTVGGIASSAWVSGRCIAPLVDRSRHGKAISPLKNWSNFVLWLGAVGGSFGVASLTATAALQRIAGLKNATSNVQLLRVLMNSSKELAAAAHIGSGVRGAMQIFGLFQWTRNDNSTFYDVFVNHMEIPVVDQARWMKILLANLFIFTNILVDIKTLHQLVTILRKRLSREEQVAPTSLTNVEMCEELYHVIMSFDTASQTLLRSNDIRPLIVLSENQQIIERIREVYEMK